MRKSLIFTCILTSFFTASAALAYAPVRPSAALQPALTATSPSLVATGTEKIGVKIPLAPGPVIIDPSLLTPTSSGNMPTPKPLPIDPNLFNLLPPLQIPPLAIPQPLAGAPLITDVQVSSDGKYLKAAWTTDQAATTRIEYGPTTSYVSSLEDKTLVTAHAVVIPAVPGTLHLRLSSANNAKLNSQTPDITVVVPEPTPVPLAPTSTETAPKPSFGGNMITVSGGPAVPPNPPTVQSRSGSTLGYLIGGAVLLVLGIIAGLLLSRRRKPQA